jgi:hypothetical protein
VIDGPGRKKAAQSCSSIQFVAINSAPTLFARNAGQHSRPMLSRQCQVQAVQPWQAPGSSPGDFVGVKELTLRDDRTGSSRPIQINVRCYWWSQPVDATLYPRWKDGVYSVISEDSRLSVSSQAHLNKVARQLNERPRETSGFETPAARFTETVKRLC